MSQEIKWKWTKQRETAAHLVADDRLNDDEIAGRVGISGKQLDRWKKLPEFKARVDEHVNLWREKVRSRGLAVKERRIETYINDFDATETILRERGAQLAGEVDAEGEPYAGGASTGYIVRDYKGKDADQPVYFFDAALFRERRAIREQIAQELGQWTEKQELSASALPVLVIEVSSPDAPLDSTKQGIPE